MGASQQHIFLGASALDAALTPLWNTREAEGGRGERLGERGQRLTPASSLHSREAALLASLRSSEYLAKTGTALDTAQPSPGGDTGVTGHRA